MPKFKNEIFVKKDMLFRYALATDGEERENETASKAQMLMEYTISLPKPMGIILSEVSEENPHAGIRISSIDPQGAAAGNNNEKMLIQDDDGIICINDMIIAVNGHRCQNDIFEEVMDRIIQADGKTVRLALGREEGNIIVGWPNGVCVGCRPGDSFGAVAYAAQADIRYSCSSGSCGMCEQEIRNEDGSSRFIRPCVARVPKVTKPIFVFPSGRFS